MRYLKLFEEMEIEESEFPKYGHDLSPRERKILIELVGEIFLNRFKIKVDDHYYHIVFKPGYKLYFNRFDNFSELKDYILGWYYMDNKEPEEYLKLLKKSKIDPSFDGNISIWWASYFGFFWHKEIVKFLLNDQRVRDKLSLEEINKYTNEIS